MLKKLFFVFAILPIFALAQHTVKGKFPNTDDFKFAFLYQVTTQTSKFVNNAEIKEDGTFTFTLDKNQPTGTYRIVYNQPQDQYNFDFLYNNEDIELTYDFDNGLTFIKSEENKLWNSYNKSIQLVGNSLNNFYMKGENNEEDFNKIIQILQNTQTEFEKAAEGKMALNFITASKPYIPSKYVDAQTFSELAKADYFKHINFSNPVLQNSNFLLEATLNYIFNFVNQNKINASYITNIDTAVNAIGNNPEVKKVILEVLYYQFSYENIESVANHIASTYLLDIAKADNDTELYNDLIYFKNASIGNKGYDFDIVIYDEEGKATVKKMHNLDEAENYLIVFWSTTCSHCLEEIPQLHQYVKTVNPKQLKVIAVALDEDRYRWKDMTYKYPEFYHVFGEGKWDNPIGDNYNVKATPSYFVLDKDKVIIKKPYDFEAFKDYFSKKLEE